MLHDNERRNRRRAAPRTRRGWLALAPFIVSGCSPSVDGYGVVENARADVIFRIQAGRRERDLVITIRPIPVIFGGIQPEYYRQFERDGDGLMDGMFVIDSFDRRTGALVWHATAQTAINPGQIDHERLRNAVRAAFAAFPAVAPGAMATVDDTPAGRNGPSDAAAGTSAP